MKSRSNSSPKADKKICEIETSTNSIYSSLETGCDLYLHRLSYQSIEEKFLIANLENMNMSLKTNIFQSHSRHKVSTK